MKSKRCLLLLIILTCVATGCVSDDRHTIATVEQTAPDLQSASHLYGESDEEWKRIYDPETYHWYRAEFNEASGQWELTEGARANRERILSILRAKDVPVTEHPVILHSGLLQVEQITPTVQRVTRLDAPVNPPSWFRMLNEDNGQWYEAYFDEASGKWEFTPDAMLQIEMDMDSSTRLPDESELTPPQPQVYESHQPPSQDQIQSAAAPAEDMAQLPETSVPSIDETARPMPDLPGLVVLNALDKTWVSAVVDGGDRTDYYMRDGDRLNLSFTRSLQVVLGNADALTLTYNGESYPTHSLTDMVVEFPPNQEGI